MDDDGGPGFLHDLTPDALAKVLAVVHTPQGLKDARLQRTALLSIESCVPLSRHAKHELGEEVIRARCGVVAASGCIPWLADILQVGIVGKGLALVDPFIAGHALFLLRRAMFGTKKEQRGRYVGLVPAILEVVKTWRWDCMVAGSGLAVVALIVVGEPDPVRAYLVLLLLLLLFAFLLLATS